MFVYWFQQDQRFDELLNPVQANGKPGRSTTKQKHRTNSKPSTTCLPDYFDSDPSDSEDFAGFRTSDVINDIPDFGKAELEMRARMETLFAESENEEFSGFTQQEM